ncbi:MAG: hypothetical protein MUP45_04925 [Candidatus Marinimicrobia bacterium]|nr:hypothetical protein [Candidatus Neomarinimicrobiota bacterium]
MNNQDNKILYPRGSEWRKWDLHVHTKDDSGYVFSSDNAISSREQSNNKYPKVFIEHIYSVDNLVAIAITDHNIANWIDRIFGENKNYATQNSQQEITIFPGVEVESSDGIHLLVIFNPETQFEEVKRNYRKETWKETIEHFLTAIRVTQGSNASKTTEEIMETAEKWDALCIFAHVTSDKGFFRISSGSTKKRIYKHKLTQIFQVLTNRITDIGQRNIIEGKDPQYCDEQKKPKSVVCVTTSDAKRLSDIGTNNCWIKADPTFEGLKQIIYEPDLRIKIQQEDPWENETYTRIEKCVINFPSPLKIQTEDAGKKTDFCMQGKYKLRFSNNLTCIIGGRGSGKSTLVHLLYNVWPKMDIVKLDELNSPLLSLDISPDPLKRVAELTIAEISANTEFFLQNEIEKFARNIDEMSGLIRHRLLRLSSLDSQISLKDLQNEWSVASRSMNELIEAYDGVSTTVKKIELIKKQIETLKKQTAVIKSKEYKGFQKEIEGINEKISAFRRYKSEYTRIIDEIDVLITAISQLDWNKEQGKNTLNDLGVSLQDSKKKLKQTFSSLERKFEANKYSEQLTKKKLQLKKYLTKKGLAEENIEELADASEQIKELEDEIRSLERQKAPFEEIYGKKELILSDYKKKYSTYHDRFFEVAARLEKELKGLPFFDKEISFTPKINEQLVREAAAEFVKKSSPAKITLRGDDIQSALFDVDDITEYLKDKEKIQTCVNQTSKTFLHKQVLQELVNNPVFLEKLYLHLWENYYDISNIQVQTKLGDKLLQNTSFGERCGIVISIVLVAGTNPIVIDQPEDNLDGKFISNVLVPLIRKRKLSRQIILVTRDANIVIGGDAELIHILESDEKKTKIVPSTIENIEHREKYIWILDGGKNAFLKREQKYNI